MKIEHKELIDILITVLEKHPEQRFGQLLFNLGINEFDNPQDPESSKFLLRDIYNDSDSKILNRVKTNFEKLPL